VEGAEAVSQPPALTEDVIHDDIVARGSHSGHSPVESPHHPL
jgi:hypothetical protein